MRKKCIEKYPLGGVHLKHTAIPHSIRHTVSGAPPLTIRTSRAALIDRIRIYGNTITDTGVGDPSANLGYPSASLPVTHNGVTLSVADGIYTISGTRTAQFALAFAVADCKADTSYTVNIIPLPGYEVPLVFLWDSTNSRTLVSDSRDTIKILPAQNAPFKLGIAYNAKNETRPSPEYKFRIMVVKGTYTAATMPDYEPYGYKIPITLQNEQSINSQIIYLSAPIYDETDYAEIANTLQSLTKGITTVSTETSVPPSKLEVSYSS